MRWQLLVNPRLLCERLATESIRRRRLAELTHTPAAKLALGHIDTLELVKLARGCRISVVYDIGANVGTWALLAKSIIPNASVHAFEPLLRHQQEFLRNTARMKALTLHPIALGASNETRAFRVTNFTDASSLLLPTEASYTDFGVREVAQASVQMFRLDDYRTKMDLPFPDLLKLDVQGYELQALQGATDCLKSVKAIISEVSFTEYYKGQCLFHELANYLAKFGLFANAFASTTATGRVIGQTDVLFLRMSDRVGLL